MSKVNKNIERTFRFDFLMNESTVSDLKRVTITHGILDVHCTGKFAPEVSPLDPEARYQVDISIAYLACCNIMPMLDWSGMRVDVEDAARRHFANLIELETPAFKPQPQQFPETEQLAGEIRDQVRWYSREEYMAFPYPISLMLGGNQIFAFAIEIVDRGDIKVQDVNEKWHTLEPSDCTFPADIRNLHSHVVLTCATLVKNA
ncbi:hypothetical protein SAMN05444008_102414 [Cnuella takakiae]|uniref:Uncharacterized protein n=1 Tax=Cnuella takakiae TaxID=1302690 RepID=A0A1M4VXD2_9BACT|nr:hypothetical protein [Cnuella takakiae]OLY92471.1 hypothetical protein BUE76_11675 [Cnuella takakiae]SHE73575.1 hypothetical protein SAMN05444008_102414 [Cnuella takakiae]